MGRTGVGRGRLGSQRPARDSRAGPATASPTPGRSLRWHSPPAAAHEARQPDRCGCGLPGTSQYRRPRTSSSMRGIPSPMTASGGRLHIQHRRAERVTRWPCPAARLAGRGCHGRIARSSRCWPGCFLASCACTGSSRRRPCWPGTAGWSAASGPIPTGRVALVPCQNPHSGPDLQVCRTGGTA